MFSRFLGGLGRTLMTAGVLILLFVAYQLWGTGIQEARSQKELRSEFAEVLERTEAAREATTTSTEPDGGEAGSTGDDGEVERERPEPVAPIAGWLPEEGAAVGEISIPDIGITRTIVGGDSVEQLKRGVGHLMTSPLPGQAGNVAIAGHRTTYGQPFHNLDKLDIGDPIEFKTVQGEFTYEVDEIFIVKPHETHILDDFGDDRVTLIACHPKYSLAERLIVTGQLVGQPVASFEGQDEIRESSGTGDLSSGITADGGLSGQNRAWVPTALWFFVCAAIWVATWLVQTLLRRRMRERADEAETRPTRGARLATWSPYLIGCPVFLVALYFFFESFSLLLPGNY